MGYTTTFRGRFTLNRCLKPEHKAYLRRFSEIRHEILREEMLKDYPDPLREIVGLPIGKDGMYFTGWIDPENEKEDALTEGLSDSLRPFIKQGFERAFVQNYGRPDPKPMWPPSYYCQWVPDHSSRGIEWNQGEKFSGYIQWLRFLMDHFLLPWGYALAGEVSYEGEQGEHGRIIVKENEIHTVVDGDSTLSRPKDIAGIDEVKKIHWMTFGAVSEAARKALLDADCFVLDLSDNPPIVLVGLVYDCNYFKRHGHDDLRIWATEGIQLTSKNLRFSRDSSENIDPSWGGAVAEKLILCGEEYGSLEAEEMWPLFEEDE